MATTTCSNAGITGKNGAVYCGGQRVARVTQWSVDASVDEKVWADSGGSGTYDTPGYVNRAAGNRSLTGTVEFKWDIVYSQERRFREGECCQLVLFPDDSDPVRAWVVGEALITRLTLTVNIEDAELTEGSFDFGSNGKYWVPFEAGQPAVFPLPSSPT